MSKTVTITGAAGQIGYQLAFRIASGQLLGANQKINLNLLEITPALDALKGVAMELEDCAFDTLGNISISDDPNEAFKDCDYAFLVGAKPRGPGMERSDLLQENAKIFSAQGKAINDNASRDIKVLVVGNPANTNALIGRNAANNSSQTWMAMTMLDSNRAKSMLAKKLSCNVSEIKKMIIWGNHSPTMFPDFENALKDNQSVASLIEDTNWIDSHFIPNVQQRGKAVIDARGASSATSAAKAALDTVIACENITSSDDCFSAAVYSDGAYGVPEGIMCGFPLMTTPSGEIEIIRDLTLSDSSRSRLNLSIDELLSEREAVKDLL